MAQFEFKKLINNKGYYAKIDLAVVPKKDKGVELKFKESSQWYPAVKFGVEYFYERYKRDNNGGIQVEVNELDTQIIDSSLMVVLYVTIKAIELALEKEVADVAIDTHGNLILPK